MDKLSYIQNLFKAAKTVSQDQYIKSQSGSTNELAGAICSLFFKSLEEAMKKVEKPEKETK